MKEKTILAIVLTLAMAVMAGCGGDGAAVDTTPQSTANYTGPQDPAVLDSTTNTQNMGVNFLSDLSRAGMQFGGDMRVTSLGTTSSSTSDFVEGGDGGSLTYSGSSSASWDATSLHSSMVQSLSFSDFADSAGIDIFYGESPNGIDQKVLTGQGAVPLAERPGSFSFFDLQAGRGTAYRSATQDLTTDGIDVISTRAQPVVIFRGGPGPVGSVLTDQVLSYVNFDAFYTSQGYAITGTDFQNMQRQILQSGFASADNMSGPYDTTTNDMPFNDTISADYAMDYFYSYESYYSAQTTNQYTQALLGFNQNHAWDLSTATFTSSGTYCAEGDYMGAVPGCVDFDVSLTWYHDASTRQSCRYWGDIIDCYGWPEDGTVTLGADGASAAFAFTPNGGTFTFYAAPGSAPFETNLTPPSPD